MAPLSENRAIEITCTASINTTGLGVTSHWLTRVLPRSFARLQTRNFKHIEQSKTNNKKKPNKR